MPYKDPKSPRAIESQKRRWKKYNDKCKNNPEYKRKRKQSFKKYNQKLRLEVLIHYGGNPPKCACCGESHIEFLTIDHIHGGGRKHSKITGLGTSFYKWLRKNNFPDGFQVLCWNCNCAKGHYGYCPHDQNR